MVQCEPIKAFSRYGGMADAADSKSVYGDIVRVQVPPPAVLDLVDFGFTGFFAYSKPTRFSKKAFVMILKEKF